MESINIKSIRMQLGVSQEKLSSLIGVTAGTINRWESGTHLPSALSLNKIQKLKDKGFTDAK